MCGKRSARRARSESLNARALRIFSRMDACLSPDFPTAKRWANRRKKSSPNSVFNTKTQNTPIEPLLREDTNCTYVQLVSSPRKGEDVYPRTFAFCAQKMRATIGVR